MTKAVDKLSKLNIPERFYHRFMMDVPTGAYSVVDKLHNTPATKRGRGLTRVLHNITEAEWNQIYKFAADGRAAMKNADRDVTLCAAICAKSLAVRMEILGVANPVEYTPKKSSRRTKVKILEDVAAEAEAVRKIRTAATTPVLPHNPPKLNKVDVPESTPAERQAFRDDMQLG